MKFIPIITGTGLITPLGRSVNQTWNALLAGRFITTHARLESPGPTHVSRAAALAMHAAGEAIATAGWTGDLADCAVMVCTSKGSVESWLTPPAPQQTSYHPKPAGRIDPAFGLADICTLLARQFKLTDGPRITMSAACAGGLHGLIRAAMMIQTGEVSRALVVATEASVHPLFLASFERLGVFPPAGEPCRPFDIHRKGFLMSEAAAAVCLEAGPREGTIAIERFAMGGDATHLTGSDPNGLVLKHLLQEVITGEPVDLVHAHGTGTVSNDQTELTALEFALPANTDTRIYSHKGSLGHSLGASGLVSVVLNCQSHNTGMTPPNTTTQVPIETRLPIHRQAIARPIRRSTAQAAGFGGPMAVVSLRGCGHF